VPSQDTSKFFIIHHEEIQSWADIHDLWHLAGQDICFYTYELKTGSEVGLK
jgi:hypothetical protein